MSDTDAQLLGRPANKPPIRQSTYTTEVADKICEHIAGGGYATEMQRFGFPSMTTINKWLNENEAFAAAYARARQARAETFAEQIVEIADTCEDPAKGRLQVEARKWVASKLFPRMYGESQRVEVQHTLSETAAQVLSDLSQRAKQRQAIERQVIDVTPVPSLSQGDVELAISTGCEETARGSHAAAPRRRGRAARPPAPATTVDPPLPEQPSLSAEQSEKNRTAPPVSAKPRRKK